MTALETHRHASNGPARGTRRGVALLLVLWIIVVLAAVTMAASSAARSSSEVVGARRADATARSMAESGIAAAVTAIDDSLFATGSDSLVHNSYLNSLDAGTNSGRSTLGQAASDSVGDGAFAVAVIDVGARLDVNAAGESALERFLGPHMPAADARALALRIAERVRGDRMPNSAERLAQLSRDSLVRALLGQDDAPTPARHPFETLDDLVPGSGFPLDLLTRLAPLLTVDGDGVINRHAAPPAVLAAASGSLADAPSRLLLIARGWQIGRPLTHEIQAVYDVSPSGLRLVRWRERVL